jgi:polyphenol oxidase
LRLDGPGRGFIVSAPTISAGYIVPEWPSITGVRALCSTRAGGVSQAPYDSLNLGDHVGDDSTAVQTNRARLAQQTGARPVFLQQVHGIHTVELHAQTSDGTQADACLTSQPNVVGTIMVADCLPVLFAHKSGLVVGAAHAGWRGLCSGVLEACTDQIFKRFRQIAGVNTAQAAIKNIANEMQVWLGPCIGPEAFEVGAEVRDAFLAHHAQANQHFEARSGGKYLANLPALARMRLTNLGIQAVYGNDGSAPWCTASNPSRFFSHRRDRVSGRMAACIWREL